MISEVTNKQQQNKQTNKQINKQKPVTKVEGDRRIMLLSEVCFTSESDHD